MGSYDKVYMNDRAFAVIDNNGSIYGWGTLSAGATAISPSPASTPTGTGYVNIFSNRQAFTAIKADGSMYSWGNQTGG
jgi:hypothetical protein